MTNDYVPDAESTSCSDNPLIAEASRQFAALANAAKDHPSQIGAYKILGELGRGGMGVVYLAEGVVYQEGQGSPVRRTVALKAIKPGMDSRRVVQRFRRELEFLARMDHPNIARAYDAGQDAHRRPYLVMEYVRGIRITDYCDRERLSIEARLRLFVEVCHAVHHAHQKGIIHRDIKPSNVLVSTLDEKPLVKVIDFGVARAMQRHADWTTCTEQDQFVGTLEYMSPEQVDATSFDVDTRTDVYALGVLLYELLTGMRPFDGHGLRKVGQVEVKRLIREVEPPKPSTRLGSPSRALRSESTTTSKSPIDSSVLTAIEEIARIRGAEPKALSRRLRDDLDWIVMKCLEKERTRRYDSAKTLASDVQFFLENKPVMAGPPGIVYRTSKFLRRHRAAAIATLLICLAGGLGTLAALQFWVQSIEQKRVVDSVVDVLNELFAGGSEFRERAPILANSPGAKPVVEQLQRIVQQRFSTDDETRGKFLEVLGHAKGLVGEFMEAEQLLREAWEIRNARHGRHDKSLHFLQCEIGQVLWLLGRHDEAEREFRNGSRDLLRRLGPQNRDALRGQFLLGQFLNQFNIHRHEEAEGIFRYLSKTQESVLGHDDPDALRSRLGLADSLVYQGLAQADEVIKRSRFMEAMEVYESIIPKLRIVLGYAIPSTVEATDNLGFVYHRLGERELAERWYCEAFDWRLMVFGENDIRTTNLLANFGNLLSESEHYGPADDYLQRALTTRIRMWGETSYDARKSLGQVARNFDRWGRAESALPYWERLLSAELEDGLPDSRTDAAARGLANCLVVLGRIEEANNVLFNAAILTD